MKSKFSLLICLSIIGLSVQAQTIQEVSAEVESVTVFIKGAQVTRSAKVQVPSGVTVLKFEKLSPYVDASTIQVKTDADIRISAVNFQKNFIDIDKNVAEVDAITKQLNGLKDKIELENTNRKILEAELSFLNENKRIAGTAQATSALTLRETSEFYDSKVKDLMLKRLELDRKINELTNQRNDYENQLRALKGKKVDENGIITVEVESSVAKTSDVTLTYVVEGAGWYPTYDIRVSGVDKPMEVVYKANVWQNTSVDWNNVKLSMSSNEPCISSVAPQLKTYYVGYNERPPRYDKDSKSGVMSGFVTGYVLDEENKPIPGANVVVEGTTIGTVTDGSGYYSITMPANATSLVYSYIGYTTETKFANSSSINVKLYPDLAGLEEVVVVGYGASKSSYADYDAVYEEEELEDVSYNRTKVLSKPLNATVVEQTDNQTSVNFDIEKPYTIKSNSNVTVVDMVQYSIPVEYQYYCVPKIENRVYLTANIIGWETYNFIEGEASISLDGAFLGKSVLNTHSATDTMQLSLGQDKSITINRTLAKDLTKRRTIGTKCEVSRDWKISIKNNRSQKINITVLDQVPVSRYQDVEVTIGNLSNGTKNNDNGTIEWKLQMEPNESKELELNYKVKYPKNRSVIVE